MTATTSAADLRRWLDAVRTADAPRHDIHDALYRLYLAVVVVGLPVGWVIAQAVQADPASTQAQSALLTGTATWLPVVALLSLLGGLRLGTWRGPVVFADADIAWLLTAPVPRDEFIRPRLVRGLAWTGALGAALGGALWVVLVAEFDVPALPLLAACSGTGAVLGGLGAAGSWAVECRPGLARVVLRATPLVLAVAVGAVLAGEGPVAVVLRWSGPWGWVAPPVLAAAGSDAGTGWPVAVGLLVLVTGLVVVWGTTRAGTPTLEELRRRAGTAQAVATGIFWLDTGTVTSARRQAVSALVGRRLPRLPFRPRRRLVIPWVGATVLLRGPWLWARAVLALSGAAVAGWAAAVAGPDALTARVAWATAAVVGVYVAAVAIVEPAKVEAEQRFGIRQLTGSARGIILTHLALPLVVLAVLTGVAGAVTALVTGVAEMAWVAGAGAALLTPGLLAVAAFGSLREPPDVMIVVAYGESGIAMYAAQAMLAMQAAVVVGLPPVLVFAASIDGGASAAAAVLDAAGVALSLAAVAAVLVHQWLSRRF